MRTIETKLYKFSELSEKAKQKAIENMYDINVCFDWWMFAYQDAEQIGLKITSFDIDRGNYCEGKFIEDAQTVANKILLHHGEQCETYKTAKTFLSDWDQLVEKYSDGITKNKVAEGNECDFDNEADDLENEFLKSLCEDFKTILSNEYEYQTSKDAIIETIEADEYEFTEEGNRY